ncbi:hypothetical protein HOLleu_25733 [Holothuria leucospilota]|uniref:Uncharacterized protein n=1 Tax=Holothuria leucospilota TaxID=206669 RepID=A0A9Q1BTF9_HOLLE|nr:hypothetical protein HOLleu_25733 [Holothuria leucospilota]
MDGDGGNTTADLQTTLFANSFIPHERISLAWTTDVAPTTSQARATLGTTSSKLNETTSSFHATAIKGLATMTSFNTTDKSLVILGVAILAGVVVITVLLLAISIVWKCKMKKKTRQTTTQKHAEPSSGVQLNIEIYENIRQGKVAISESNYENTKWPVEYDLVLNSSLNEQQCGTVSQEVIRRYELDTPDGTYETPNVDVYSYADPNELRPCLK